MDALTKEKLDAMERHLRIVQDHNNSLHIRLQYLEAQHGLLLRTFYRFSSMLADARTEAQRIRTVYKLPLFKHGIPDAPDSIRAPRTADVESGINYGGTD